MSAEEPADKTRRPSPKRQLLARAAVLHGVAVVVLVGNALDGQTGSDTEARVMGGILGIGLAWANYSYVRRTRPRNTLEYVVVGGMSFITCLGSLITLILLIV